MKKLTEKRTKGRAVGRLFPATLLFFLFFPYLGSLLKEGGRAVINQSEYICDTWVEIQQPWGKEKLQLEEYLAGMMAATIPLTYEAETLKAQAILLRSWCYSLAKKEEGRQVIQGRDLEQVWISTNQLREFWKEDYEAEYGMIQKILEQTEGMVLVWQGEIIGPPFFRLSNGTTRTAEEYQPGEQKWGYLTSYLCPQDLEAEEYLGRVEVSQRKFEQKVGELLEEKSWTLDKIILHRDHAGYVKTVEIEGKQIPGEKFRYTFGLASSCFALEKQEEQIVIKTKGIGHGFGFSQHQANELAKQGYTYRQLLESFFQDVQIARF